MTPETIINQMAGDGLSLTLTTGGQIDVTGEATAIERWLPQLRKCKPEIFAALSSAMQSDLPYTDELAVRSWLRFLGEDDLLSVEQLIYRCKVDTEARDYFISRSMETPESSDDRRWCSDCQHLGDGGYCKGEPDGTAGWYRPWQGLPRRCERFSTKYSGFEQVRGVLI